MTATAIRLHGKLRSAVLRGQGDAIRFRPRRLDPYGHHHCAPSPRAVAMVHEKGRVGRTTCRTPTCHTGS